MFHMQTSGLLPLAPGVYFVEAENNGRFPFAHGLLLTGPETVNRLPAAVRVRQPIQITSSIAVTADKRI